MSAAGHTDKAAGREFIEEGVRLFNEGRREAVLIHNLVAHLPRMFPEGPSWVTHHVRDAEAQVAYSLAGKEKRAFIDSLVGSTTIEYEHDLTSPPVFSTGLGQVHQHVAGLINAGVGAERIVGVLSDTLRWRAYRVRTVGPGNERGLIGQEDIELEEVASIDVSGGTDLDVDRLLEFLEKYLGREGSRRLSADTIAYDLGFESGFCVQHLSSLEVLVKDSLEARPEYAKVIERLWADFVGYLGNPEGTGDFDPAVYVSELYMVTLSKLLCANVIAEGGLHSDDSEVAAILDGRHFEAKGIENLVEYDYFGWLNETPYVDGLIPIAREMQRDLRAYDFESLVPEDLFGQMLAQLARRLQRTLLGQERTPPWLAEEMARHLVDQLPPEEQPRFIDMCCGSGSMLVEVVKVAKERLAAQGEIDASAIAELTQVATGFDIDPLAVVLAKVNWVVAARDWLAPFDGSRRISVPVYLADSMFAKTPINSGDLLLETDSYDLSLHGQSVALPVFLVSPEFRLLFDALLDRGYHLGMAAAGQKEAGQVKDSDVATAMEAARAESGTSLDEHQTDAAKGFLSQLVTALENLQRQGLNGIWAFVLRNSYRPGLVVGQFNGIISNPPWLALSKLANNPYKDALRTRADLYGITPPGASHLHLELATTFLLHAIDHYLRDGAIVGCILPETVLNGHQHTPFRRRKYRKATRPVELAVTELWRVETGTFKNEAIALFGTKGGSEPDAGYPGRIVGPEASSVAHFSIMTLGDRVIWSDSAEAAEGAWFNTIRFRQGADVMPRVAIFFEATSLSADRARIESIDRANSPLAYLVKEGKRMLDFTITPRVVSAQFLFDVLLSKHLVPFSVASPAEAFLPIERAEGGRWMPVSQMRLAAEPTAQAAFDEILAGLSQDVGHEVDLDEYFHSIDSDRKKLSVQTFPDEGFLVLQGAGGTYTCAGYAPLHQFDLDRLIVDQTLYWTVVDTEEEALYLAGLFNSDALDRIIAGYQPKGQFGRRHVHELPLKVTPAYDSSKTTHSAVVETTRQLLAEFSNAKTDAKISTLFDPSGHLPSRRGFLRSKVIPNLKGFAAYEEACEALYGLGE